MTPFVLAAKAVLEGVLMAVSVYVASKNAK